MVESSSPPIDRPLPLTCAECGAPLAVACVSYYFARPLCSPCYHAETRRSKKDAEIWLLEQLFTRSAA